MYLGIKTESVGNVPAGNVLAIAGIRAYAGDTITTTSEFANELVRLSAEKLGSNKTQVKGALISTLDLGNEIDYQSKKQFMGIKQYVIDKEMSGDEITEMLKKCSK